MPCGRVPSFDADDINDDDDDERRRLLSLLLRTEIEKERYLIELHTPTCT